MKIIHFILFPFSGLYNLVTKTRNILFDKNILSSFEFTLPVINVGNLRVGGTGKTPMVEFITKVLLDHHYHVGIISRGYGRKTSGFRLLSADDTPRTVGDEPMQYFDKFHPRVKIAVCEKRLIAIPALLNKEPLISAVVLDDAFQHRRVKAGLNILLSTYQSPFFSDYLLPSGRLRESRRGAHRANIVVFTKCPKDMSASTQRNFEDGAHKYIDTKIPIYFSTIEYGLPQPLFQNVPFDTSGKLVLVTGLADPLPMFDYVDQNYGCVRHLNYPDHHTFNPNDVSKILNIMSLEKCSTLLVSEKDATKLRAYSGEFAEVAVFYLPIVVGFLNNELTFKEELINFVSNFEKS